MKINELKRIAEENDYEYEMRHFQYKLKKMQGTNCITISNDVEKTLWISNKSYCDNKDFNMIKAAVEFAKTPIDEREEEKKFYLKHRYFKCTNGDSRYFQIYESNGTPWLNAMYTVMGYKKQFTLIEIENMGEKFHTNFEDFELVEVEDE